LQRQAVRQGDFDEAPWLGFGLNERPYRIDEISLSPTLDEATVTYTRWYMNRGQVDSDFPLQHVAIYRRGEDRWLLALPPADFWGRQATIREEQLTIRYPERDEDQVSRLAEDLVASLPQICNGLPFGNCPDGWQVTVNLSSDLEAKIIPTRIEGPFDDLLLTLPAPSLLGIPVDGVGYNAVLQSYQGRLQRVVTATLNRYLIERPELIPPVLEVGSVGGEFFSTASILPEAEMTFTCSAGDVGWSEWNAYRYSLRTGSWQIILRKEYTGEDSGLVIPLPSGDGYIIQEYLRDDLLTARLLLWQNGQEFLIGQQLVNFDNALQAPFYARQLDPPARFLVISTSNVLDSTFFLLDRQSCDEATGCKIHSIISVPIWSPDGEQMLLEEPLMNAPTYRLLYRTDETGQNSVELGEGGAPFWLNERTYGYVRPNSEDEVELVLADSTDDTVRVWVETADLIPLAPADRNWVHLNIWNVWVNPADPQMMLLMTTPTGVQNSGPYDFFLVQGDPDRGEEPRIEWLFSHDFPASGGTEIFSPDGRYLLATLRGTPIHFRDLETGEMIPFDLSLGFFAGWSPDGRYYIQRSDEAVTLTSPTTSEQLQVIYDFSTCLNIEWFQP
jgi:hypothetical protein